MPISPVGGAPSRPPSQNLCPSTNCDHAHDQRGERGIWQRRYWEHTIRNDRDFAAHMDYTHFNPVKHRLVEYPADWPHSSFHWCVANGLYPAEWRGDIDEPQETGERL
jgi:putative transposase